MESDTKDAWAVGLGFFAAVMMLVVGGFQIMMGLTAIFANEVIVTLPNYLVTLDTSVWGWIHLLFGILLVLAGFFLFQGAPWARGVAIVLAAFQALLNFLWLPYSPIWSILIIAVDVLVIWALAAHGEALKRATR